MIAESIIGAMVGGASRLFTAWLEYKDKDKDRDHEWRMFKGEAEVHRQDRAHELKMQDMQMDMTNLNAIVEVNKVQAKTGVGWVDALSATVRPVITYWFMLLYSAVKVAYLVTSLQSGNDWTVAILSIWSQDDIGIFSAIMMFWFLDRHLVKKTK